MAALRIEHVNLSVADPAAAAASLQHIFGWEVRWTGPGRNGRAVYHVGTRDHYLALSQPDMALGAPPYALGRPLNHVGVEVEDLDAVEVRVAEAGFEPFNHGDYEPGRRFYFLGPDGLEFEVISYAAQPGR